MSTSEQRETRHYTYIMLIDGKYFYIGQGSSQAMGHTPLMRKTRIYLNSGNQMMKAYSQGIISFGEYRERCKIIKIKYHETREDALDREEKLIRFFKKYLSNRCLNISPGNRHRGCVKEFQHSYPHLKGERIVSLRKVA